MPSEQSAVASCQTGVRRFKSSVHPGTRGGWVTTIDLGEGASLSRWFEDQASAARYPDELAKWLAGTHDES